MKNKREAGQAMAEYLVVTLVVVIVLLAPYPSAGSPSVLTQLVHTIGNAYQDYSRALSIPD
ncbi:hypothetical protein AB4090_13080 [Acidithiobacillus sp. IBUN Pt1247-S3]|uniref:hypothetical protein n=1 Tax=Acidithiobacillus sp. IBUN Pt1247-S3 TaxID=3166642 RepID=UPI0034E572AE